MLLKNNEGKTALDIAIESNHIYCAGALRSVEGKVYMTATRQRARGVILFAQQLQEQDSSNATVNHALGKSSPLMAAATHPILRHQSTSVPR